MFKKILALVLCICLSLAFLSACAGEVGPQGEAGKPGADGNGIVSIEKTASDGLVDTYTITFTNGTTTTFTVTNGTSGKPGTDGKPGESGLSAYEIYIKYHPEYTGTEEEWINDLVNGKLGGDDEPKEPHWNDDGELKILAIGNSFSIDTMSYAYDVAKSLGIEKITLGNLVIGGCVIDTHYNNITSDKAAYKYYYNNSGSWNSPAAYDHKISTAIESDNWDFISVQQGSAESGIASTYSNLSSLVTKVKELADEDTKIVFNMTWAYQSDSTHNSFPNYSNDQMTMYSGIVDAMQKCVVTNENIDIIVPNGTAVQNARNSSIGDNLTRDGYHLNYDYGRYLAALTYISTLTGRSLENISYKPSGVTNDQKAICITSAMNAIADPFVITTYAGDKIEPTLPEQDQPTPPKDPVIPGVDLENYELVELEIQIGGFYNSQKGDEFITNSSIANQFFVTQKFTREDLPVGSIIVVEDGWQHRPEGWGTGTTRPANVTDLIVVITEEWWGNYTTRAFNVSRTDSANVTGYTEEALVAVFKIYVPKK